jgi:hypothetical protein
VVRRRRAQALLVGLLALVPARAHALHRNTAPAIRVTDGASVALSPTRSWGRTLAFTADDAQDRRQAYLFSLFDYDCEHLVPGPTLRGCPSATQPFVVPVTDGPGEVDDPSLDGSHTLVAFDADGAYGGGTGPGVGHRQVFLLNRLTKELVRVTDAADGDSVRPSLSEHGGALTFESTASLAGGGAGVSQVFVWTLRTRAVVPVTHGTGPSTHPMLDERGTLITFESTAALTGDGHDTGVSQVFWYDVRHVALHQLTAGNGPSHHPWMSTKFRLKAAPGDPVGRVRGPAVVFDSTATDLPGTAGGPGLQLYAGTTRLGDLPLVAQLTPARVAGCTPPSAGSASDPAVDPFDKRISFIGTADLLCNGTSGDRLFVLDVSVYPHALRQITARGDVRPPVGVPLGIWFATAVTSDDLTGGGVCAPQLHIVNFSSWPAAKTSGTSPPDPTPGDPAASCDDADACTTDSCDAAVGCRHVPVVGCP